MPTLNAYLSLAGALGATVGFAMEKRWLLAAGGAVGAASRLFDKFYPDVLPQPVVDGLAVLSIALILAGIGKLLAAGHKAQATR